MTLEYDCCICGTHCHKQRTPGNLNGRTPPRFCSRACAAKDRAKRATGKKPNHKFACIQCGKTVETYRSSNQQTPQFCSLLCLGKSQTGDKNPSYTGGRFALNTGYIVVLNPTHPNADVRGYVLEHRLVMEAHLGRLLDPKEVVHHKNGVVDDNRVENLRVFPSQAEHQRHHRQNPDAPGNAARP